MPAVSNKPLKTLIIPPSYFASDRVVGGGERYAHEFAKAMAKLTPTTLALFDRTPGKRQEESLTIETFKVYSHRQRFCFPLSLQALSAIRQFDIFHIMVFPTPLTDLLILLARLWGKTVVLTDVGGGGPCWSTYLQKISPKGNLNRFAHGLAFLTRYASRFYSEWNLPTTQLYGGVNAESITPASHPPKGYALFVGRLLPHKGVLQVIQAISPHSPLHVVGRPYDPAYLEKLKEAAQGKDVTFIHDADDAELQRQYHGASVVLQPSLPAVSSGQDKSELLGLVALEGMASARPVIVTQTTSLPELVLEGSTGYVVQPHDENEMRKRIEFFIQHPDEAVVMGRRAREHVLQHFTWDKAAEVGLSFYRKIGPKKP